MAASLVLDAYEVSGSIDIQNNTSRVYVRLQIVTTRGTYNHTGDTTGSVSVNGQTFSLDGKNVDYNTTTVLYEATHTVTHTADGSKTLTVAAEFDPNTPATDRMTVTKTVTLTTIPRASTLAATDANIGSVSMIAINRRSESYSHCLLWQFGQLAGWLTPDGAVSQEPVWFTQTSVAFALPESFYSQIPDAPSGVCQLTCLTYLGDQQIGQPQVAYFQAVADPMLCSPDIHFSVEDSNPATVALTGDKTKLVRYMSTARCDFTARGMHGAVILEKKLGDRVMEGDTLELPLFSGSSITYSATDSRGYATYGGTLPLKVEYIPLTVNLTAGRTDPTSGRAVVQVRGNCFTGDFGTCRNRLQVLCRVGQQEKLLTVVYGEGCYEATGEFEGLDYLQSHGVTVTVTDLLDTQERSATVGKGIPVFDWGEGDFTFHVPVSVPAPTADDHAVNRGYALNKNGDSMTGPLAVPELMVRSDAFPGLQLRSGDGTLMGSMVTSKYHGSLYLSNNRGELYEAFFTPPMDGDRTQSESYLLLTSKHPVTLAQGGTGAGDAASARANLGIGCQPVLQQVLESNGVIAALADGFKGYLVMGYPRSGSGVVTSFIPRAALTTDPAKFQLADNTDYCAFEMWLGQTPGIRKVGGTGAITAVFGIN